VHVSKYLSRLQERLGEAGLNVVRAFERMGLELFVEPTDGMFVWARLPQIEDSLALAEASQRDSITLAPGAVFRPHLERSAWMPFNVTVCDEPRVQRWLHRQSKATSIAAGRRYQKSHNSCSVPLAEPTRVRSFTVGGRRSDFDMPERPHEFTLTQGEQNIRLFAAKANFDRMESTCRVGKGALLSLSKDARRAHQSTAFGGHASLCPPYDVSI
jgi:hypothetical protein